MNKNAIILILSMFIPILTVFGVFYARHLDRKGIQVAPLAVGLGIVITILLCTVLFIYKKTRS